MLYKLARQVLFAMPTEFTHEFSLHAIAKANQLKIPLNLEAELSAPVEVMGIEFKNPVGLAAGLDKNGDCIDGLAALGFGFIEIGTITPRPQPGNPKPRLFRAPEQQALVNRMGFNNKGVDHLVAQVQKASYEGVLGINIGKNKDTPIENANDDYLACLRKVYEHATYVTVNISSPNTADLRSLQHGDALSDLLSVLKDEQGKLESKHQKRVPMVVKIAPDLNAEEIDFIAETLLAKEVEGLIVSNTTADKSSLENKALANEAGGLSGAPLLPAANHVQKEIYKKLEGKVPIIGVGGICSAEDAQSKFDLGASLVQVYTGFIYEGPGLISDIVRSCKVNSKISN
jgi:dihydroorotate dehydrogenase